MRNTNGGSWNGIFIHEQKTQNLHVFADNLICLFFLVLFWLVLPYNLLILLCLFYAYVTDVILGARLCQAFLELLLFFLEFLFGDNLPLMIMYIIAMAPATTIHSPTRL